MIQQILLARFRGRICSP